MSRAQCMPTAAGYCCGGSSSGSPPALRPRSQGPRVVVPSMSTAFPSVRWCAIHSLQGARIPPEIGNAGRRGDAGKALRADDRQRRRQAISGPRLLGWHGPRESTRRSRTGGPDASAGIGSQQQAQPSVADGPRSGMRPPRAGTPRTRRRCSVHRWRRRPLGTARPEGPRARRHRSMLSWNPASARKRATCLAAPASGGTHHNASATS